MMEITMSEFVNHKKYKQIFSYRITRVYLRWKIKVWFEILK